MKIKKIFALILSVSLVLSIFPMSVSAGSDTIAEFANFKACWGGDGENRYFKITDSYIDGTSNGAIVYAGTAALPDKISVSIDWALTNAYTADVSVYALPLKDTNNDGTATAEETDSFYTANLDSSKISSETAPILTDGILIADLSNYTGADGNWSFSTLSLTTQNPAAGEKAIFFTTTCKEGSNGLTGNFKNLIIKESSDGKQTVNITKNNFTKSVTFTNIENNKTYEITEETGALGAGTYRVTANSYAPATYNVAASPSEITVTDTSGSNVTVSCELRTENLPQTNYETVKNNIIEWSDSNGYTPNSLNYIDGVEGKSDIAVAGAEQGKSTDSDVYMLVNTQSGKFHTYGRQWSMQINGGTVLKVPVVKDTKVTLDASSFVYTVNGREFAGTQDYFYLNDENGYAEINIIDGGYASSIKTTPLSRTAVSGSVSGAEDGCIMFSDTVSGDIQYAEITSGGYSVNLLSGQSYVIKYGALSEGSFTASDSKSTDVGGITPSGSAQSQNIEIIGAVEYAIGGDVVDIKKGETLKITDGSSEYDVTAANGKWSALVPNGVYNFKLSSDSNGELSELSKNSFAVLENNSSVKNVLVLHPVTPLGENVRAVTVGSDGDYVTINDALDAIEAADKTRTRTESERITITLKGGETFREQILVNSPYLTFTTDADTPAKITWYYGNGYKYYSVHNGYYDRDYAVAKTEKGEASDWGVTLKTNQSATGFRAENVIIEKSFNLYYTSEEVADGVEGQNGDYYNRTLKEGDDGYKAADDSGSSETQSAALYNNADNSEYFNCQILGSQDTLFTGNWSNHSYYNSCAIMGGVDFIYGGGAAVFDACDLIIGGKRDKIYGGHITANWGDGSNYYLFRNCTIKNNPDTNMKCGTPSWGRNWGGTSAKVYFFNTKAGKGVTLPTGWSQMGNVALSACDLYVYDFSGQDAGDNSNPHGVLSEEEAYNKYYSGEAMAGDWNPVHMPKTKEITIDKSELTLKTGDTEKLTATVVPTIEDVYKTVDPRVTWTSATETTATVADDGTVTAALAGTSTVKAASKTRPDITAACDVTVNAKAENSVTIIPAAGVTIKVNDQDALTEVEEGMQVTVTAEVTDNRYTLTSLKYNDTEIKSGDSFTMPAEAVTITAETEVKPVAAVTVEVTPSSVQQGQAATVTASARLWADEGKTIELTDLYTDAEVSWSLDNTTTNAGKTTISGTGLSASIYVGSEQEHGAVTVTAAIGDKSGNGTITVAPETLYMITIDDIIEHGMVTTDPSGNAAANTEVAITVTPDSGYQLKDGTLKVTKENNVEVTVTNNRFTMPAEAVTITAEFEKIDYTISISAQNGTISVTDNKQRANIGDEITFTVSPSEGYQLKVGSVKVNNGAVNVSESGGTYTFAMPAADVAISAEFEARIYTVIYNKNGGMIANENNYIRYTYGTGLTLPEPTKEGYTFGGWYDNEDYTGEAVTVISATDAVNKEYWAKWTKNETPITKYLITFVNYNGEELQSGEVTAGVMPSYTGATPTKPNDERYSYTFSGWSPEITVASGAATYTAQFTAAEIKYTYSLEYVDEKAVVTVPEAGEYTLILAAYKNGMLISFEMKSISFETAGRKEFEPESFRPGDADKVKLMLWDSIESMTPVYDSKTFDK